ncbi:hypothetical protein [Natronorubrum sp. FCH18a]|uniref:hypothetical protein n=1 Tax=Natronorubrum sp. FCH18a TaxID=3447018 RepID=UPI003F5149DA
MASAEANRLYEQFEERFGDALRSVCYYDGDGNNIEHIREEIETEYKNGDLDRVFREARLEAIGNQHQESMYIHGSLQCTLRCFEDATELHIILSETEGLMAAVDAGAIDDLRGTINLSLEAIDS